MEKDNNKEDSNSNNTLKFYTLITLYIAFMLSFLVAIVPVNYVSIFAMMICICVLSGAYSLRIYEPEDSLYRSHLSHIIKIFWRANIYLAATSFIAILYMLVEINYAPLEPCIETMATVTQNGNIDKISKIMGICSELLIEHNKKQLMIMEFIALSPIFVYVLYQSFSGWISLISEEKP